jgi:hypothetical protein
MSLPALVDSPGAVYRGAWRAQDAVIDGSDYVITIPSLVGGSGAAMTARFASGGVMSDGPDAAVMYLATGLDGGPAIQSLGNGGTYTTDATVLSTGQGSTAYQTFVRCAWNYGERFSGVHGFEAWVENQCAYLESGDDGAPDALTQLDRGQSRRQQGTEPYAGGAWTIELQADTDADVSAFTNGSGTPENVYSFFANQATWSAYMTGPVQRTASSTAPPGIFSYSNTLYWSRHVLVSTPSGFLGPTDRANLIAWVEGTDFPPAAAAGNGFFFGMAP